MGGPWDKANGSVAFDVIVTVEDRVAFDRHMLRRGPARRRLANYAFAGCVAAPIIALAIVLIARGALAGTGCDLDEEIDSAARLRVFLQATAGVAIVEALVAGALLALRARIFEANTRARLRGRPGVDPRDPSLSETSRCAVDAEGFRIESPGLSIGATWAFAKGFDETADHMFVLTGPFEGLILPKRDLPPATVLAVRDLARANVRPVAGV